MPHRKILITQQASDAIYGELGLNVPSGLYESEKGDIGSIITRHMPEDGYDKRYRNQMIRVTVSLAGKHGCEEYEPVSEEQETEFELPEEPRQVAMTSIFTSTPYNETSHLRPNGKKR